MMNGAGATLLVLALCVISVRADVSTVNDLKWDENGRLAEHMLLYPSGKCTMDFHRQLRNADSSQRTPASVTLGSELYEHMSTNYAYNDVGCFALCLERGTDRDQILSPMPHHVCCRAHVYICITLSPLYIL
jgi:hypothetical protein